MPEPLTSAAIIASVIAAGAGAAMTAKGQKDAKKANKAALAQQSANFETQQAENLRRYMLSRGVDTANGNRPVNTYLPLWATVRRKRSATPLLRPPVS